MTSFVLLNDMKAEGSWALLGLTCRLAQSLGLHRPQVLDGRESPGLRKREMVRRKLWYDIPSLCRTPSIRLTRGILQVDLYLA
jgi:hypothetical protein